MKEFTLTTTERPELLEVSLQTFTECLKDVDTSKNGKIYANLDPVPYNEEGVQKETLDICRELFAEVEHRIGPEGGSFQQAINWAFTQPENEFFFHLEDDWRFYDGDITWEACEQKIRNAQNCLQCTTASNPGGQRIHFPPNMFHAEKIQAVVEKYPVPDYENPERYLMHKAPDVLGDYSVECYRDIKREHLGREWLEEKNIGKINPDPKIREVCPGEGDWKKWDISEFKK